MQFPKPEKRPKKLPKPIKRSAPPKRKTPLKAKRSAPRRTERIVDQGLLDTVRSQPCTSCKAPPPSDPDHITHRGAGGDDREDNVMPLCRRCHTKRHALGWSKFFTRHPGVRAWLEKMGRHDILSRAASSESLEREGEHT